MAERNEPPDSPEDPTASPAVDPITGTRPVGPITKGDPTRRGGWPMAAQWFLLLILAMIVIGGIMWFSAER